MYCVLSSCTGENTSVQLYTMLLQSQCVGSVMCMGVREKTTDRHTHRAPVPLCVIHSPCIVFILLFHLNYAFISM